MSSFAWDSINLNSQVTINPKFTVFPFSIFPAGGEIIFPSCGKRGRASALRGHNVKNPSLSWWLNIRSDTSHSVSIPTLIQQEKFYPAALCLFGRKQAKVCEWERTASGELKLMSTGGGTNSRRCVGRARDFLSHWLLMMPMPQREKRRRKEIFRRKAAAQLARDWKSEKGKNLTMGFCGDFSFLLQHVCLCALWHGFCAAEKNPSAHCCCVTFYSARGA